MESSNDLFDRPLLIVGLVRNGEGFIEKNIARLNEASSKFKKVHWLLIESDSTDATLSILANLSKKIENFKYISEGNLVEKFPLRTARIAHCRNIYLHEIRNNMAYQDVEFVIVSDLDDTNSLLTEEGLLSCWAQTGWDICTANQQGPYYDVWALRHPFWSPNDCWLGHQFLMQYSKRPNEVLYSCVFSKMIEIPQDSQWIEVDSAFGGLAIYKKSIMSHGEYIGLYDNGSEICEHVPFHSVIRNHGGRIFINPKMINTDYTEHSLPLKA
jgi:glycosyltransferase involved in cell wall biosynthesis